MELLNRNLECLDTGGAFSNPGGLSAPKGKVCIAFV